jgi:RNA polymerase sigma factor (sigma-70 family)
VDHRDRPLAGGVDVGERAPLGLGAEDGADTNAERLELGLGAPAEIVVAEGREERGRAGEPRELDGGDSSSPGGLRPGLRGRDDLACKGDTLDADEVDPLDVTEDGDSHSAILTSRRLRPFQQMMEAMTVPPFERFYTDHRDEVFGYLVRALGRQAAEDAFQETFLRALRAYPKLEHGRHLRAWIFTIASRIAVDEHRRRRPGGEAPEGAAADAEPAYAELAHLTDQLPPTERAAVVLRYGYDLAYEDIGAALGSSEEAARQAASAGVRRLRRRRSR